jgi:hypothetical protein
MYAAQWYSTMPTCVFLKVFVQKEPELLCYVAKT